MVIIGTGEQGRVVLDILLSNGLKPDGFLNIPPFEKDEVCGFPVLGDTSSLFRFKKGIVALGDNLKRKEVFLEARSSGLLFVNAIHSSAVISDFAKLGNGVVIGAGVVINTGAEISDNTIINTGAIIEHDCFISRDSHIGPGAVLGGGVFVGECSFIGLSAVILPDVKIGKDVLVGAGSVVTRDVPDGLTVKGVPAKP
jgi:sugar O-acyltransferase (sialic acid O-acetyltransferase NeuD family)